MIGTSTSQSDNPSPEIGSTMEQSPLTERKYTTLTCLTFLFVVIYFALSQVDYMLESIHSPRRPSKCRINYLMIVCMLVALLCSRTGWSSLSKSRVSLRIRTGHIYISMSGLSIS